MPNLAFPKLPRLPSLPRFRRKQRPRVQGQVTALDVDGATLRVVQATSHGNRIAVTRIVAQRLEFAADVDRTDPNVLAAAIARALAQLGLKPGPVVMGVPRAQVVLRTLQLPVLDDLRELASMVHFQVGRDLPFRMDEAVIDFKVRRKITPPVASGGEREKGGKGAGETAAEPAPLPKLEVLVAAVQREVVDFYQQLADLAGFRLVTLGLLSYANARCVEACNVADGDQPVALVSLRPDEMNIDVIAQQTLLFSRGAPVKPHGAPVSDLARTASGSMQAGSETGAPRAGQDAPLAEPTAPTEDSYADAVTIEVVRSLHSFSGMETQTPVTKIAVTGATGQERAVVERLEKRFTTPCVLLDLATALELPGESAEHAPGAIATIGLALGVHDATGLPFDFLNPKRPAVQRDLRRIRILAGIAAAIAMLVAASGVRQWLINRRLTVLQAADAELADAKSKQPIYQKMIRQHATVQEWEKGGRNWLEHYAYLSAILPSAEEIYLASFSVSGNGAIVLSVQARSGEILAKLDKQLRAAGYDVKPLAITPGADRYGYEFRSSVELFAPEKMKLDLSKIKSPARPADDASLDPKLGRRGGAG
jgi:Tfp pilus assembly PilM family ATPase